VTEPLQDNVIDLMKSAMSQGIITAVANGIPVVSTGVAYGAMFPISEGTYAFGIKASSGGTIGLKIELEQGFKFPETAGAADDDWEVPIDAAEFEDTLSVATFQIKAYPPAATPYGRLKFTGVGSNAATTKIEKSLLNILK